MKSDAFIGKGTWLDKVAYELTEREKMLGRSLSTIRVESGLGASGIPHLGSLGDAVRAYGIAVALRDMGYHAELLAYSDDMDGLRKVPSGFSKGLASYIAKPVSSIPDPYGSCHSSYGAHMTGLLLDSLDRLGIQYTHISGESTYKQGYLVNQIDLILKNHKKIGKSIARIVGQDKYLGSLPYFPICDKCGRVYVASPKEYFPDKRMIEYKCDGTTISGDIVEGCGYHGETYLEEGKGKLPWKVEFAARWQAFDIRFEGYGKDILDSVRINDWISDEILHFAHPMHIKYEMFLDKGGKKISKSSGNVLTPQTWLRYGTPESLLLLLYKRISGTRHVDLEDIPNLMDEYDFLEDIFFEISTEANIAKRAKLRGIYEYIHQLNPPSCPSLHVPYRILAHQALLFRGDEKQVNKVYDRLVKYGLVKDKNGSLINKIQLASNWSNDHLPATLGRTNINVSETEQEALFELIQFLENIKTVDDKGELAIAIQSKIFSIGKSKGLQPKGFFKLLYKILINAETGPRLGNFIADMGINWAYEHLNGFCRQPGNEDIKI
ncbi:MAG TPA: lysine--tRNA ligase [Nitrososphaeraceae archaeon]|nr:lysine--tRNA ligase [Nitrososphaeraceae archaeon]